MSENDTTNGGYTAHRNHDGYKELYHWVYVAGFCLLTGVVDFIFLWPESHHGAFLVLAAAWSLVTIYEMAVRGWTSDWIIAGVFFWFVAAQVANAVIGPIREPMIPPIVGWLQPANEPTPPNGCDRVPPDRRPTGSPVVLIGNSTFVPSNPTNYDAIQIGNCMGLGIRRGPSGTAISTDLYSRNGQLIGKLRDNGFSLAGDQRLTVERSGDLSALIVHDQEGAELLYVRLLNPGAIRIRGIFSCPIPQLQWIAVTDDGIVDPRHNTFVIGCAVGGRVGMRIGP